MGRLTWRRFWEYHRLVLREAGWPPVRDWIGALVAAAIAGGMGKAVTGDWSWLVPVLVGVGAGLAFYGLDLARAAADLHLRQTEKIRRLRGEEPEIDPRLELVEESPELTPEMTPDPPWVSKAFETMGIPKDRLPEHRTIARFRVLEALSYPVVQVKTTAPIYGGFGEYKLPDSEKVWVPELDSWRRQPRRVSITLGNDPLPAGCWIRLTLYSPEPVFLSSVLAATRPAAPPPTTAG